MHKAGKKYYKELSQIMMPDEKISPPEADGRIALSSLDIMLAMK